jgi:hypothetical protein
MALINCPSGCGNQISDTADHCPHCGYTEKKEYRYFFECKDCSEHIEIEDPHSSYNYGRDSCPKCGWKIPGYHRDGIYYYLMDEVGQIYRYEYIPFWRK